MWKVSRHCARRTAVVIIVRVAVLVVIIIAVVAVEGLPFCFRKKSQDYYECRQ
jgi:hypothetical protein